VNNESESKIQEIDKNYDAVFKDALFLFKNNALDFFGLSGDITIGEPLRTETKEIHVEWEFSDLTFRLSDGTGSHAEEEVSLSKNDLLRFCAYHVNLMRTYNIDFTTVIFVKNSPKHLMIDSNALKFNPVIIDCNR